MKKLVLIFFLQFDLIISSEHGNTNILDMSEEQMEDTFNFRSNSNESTYRGVEPKIRGGHKATISMFPQIAAIVTNKCKCTCTGLIIATRWIITAAHCIAFDTHKVKYNTDDLSNCKGDEASIRNMFRHPTFEVHLRRTMPRNRQTVTFLRDDVGLLHTESNMLLRYGKLLEDVIHNIHPTFLMDKEFTILGFGKTREGEYNTQLFYVKKNMVYCARSTWRYCICSSGDFGALCPSDSGAPAVVEGRAAAINSLGTQCDGNAQFPTGVFTTLYYYREIINYTLLNYHNAGFVKLKASGLRPSVGVVVTLLVVKFISEWE